MPTSSMREFTEAMRAAVARALAVPARLRIAATPEAALVSEFREAMYTPPTRTPYVLNEYGGTMPTDLTPAEDWKRRRRVAMQRANTAGGRVDAHFAHYPTADLTYRVSQRTSTQCQVNAPESHRWRVNGEHEFVKDISPDDQQAVADWNDVTRMINFGVVPCLENGCEECCEDDDDADYDNDRDWI